MANLYGVANAPGLPLIISNLGADIAIPANTTTPIYTTGPFVAPSQGYFYAMIWADLVITNTATLNTGMTLSVAIGAGSQNTVQSIGAYGLTASASDYISFVGATPVSQVAWQGAGSTLTFAFFCSTNAATIRGLSNITVCLFRAPDQ